MNKSQFVLDWSFNVVLDTSKTQWDESYEVENYIYFQLIAHVLVDFYSTTFLTCFGVNDIPEDGFYY